jgi:hypothetical protein
MLCPQIELWQSIQYRIPSRPVPGSLTPRSNKVVIEIGHSSSQDRNNLGPNPGSQMPGIGIRRIDPGGELTFAQIGRQLDPPVSEQGANQVAADASHARETGGAGPCEQTHQNGFRLVIPVVSSQDDICTSSEAQGFEPLISFDPRLGLTRIDTQLDPTGLDRKAVDVSELNHLVGDRGAVRLNTVIQMGYDQAEGVPVSRTDQQVQKGNGIRASRDGDQGGFALKLHCPKTLLKSVEQAHEGKLTLQPHYNLKSAAAGSSFLIPVPPSPGSGDLEEKLDATCGPTVRN